MESITDKVLFRVANLLGNPYWFMGIHLTILSTFFGFKNARQWWPLRAITGEADISILDAFFRETGITIHDLNSILEIGGGYGDLAKSIRNNGYKGIYSIRDLPVMQKLQDSLVETIHTTLPKPDLFIAWMSFSEMAVPLRKEYENSIRDAKYVCINYQFRFHDIDNRTYFTDLIKDIPNKEWKETITDIKGDNKVCLLIGKPIK
jgi:hypothetical protein